MESLSLTPQGGNLPPQTSPILPEPKSPGLAFALSLMVPGLGQLYCGQKRRASWTFLFFALAAGCVVAFFGSAAEGGNLILGLGLRTALVLYGFSFLDAYFTAQEMTTGVHQSFVYNPRIAAVLNLLTRGFGYWYVDEKKKGVALFILVGVANRAALALNDARFTVPLFVLAEGALAAMAVDAYRIAARANEEFVHPAGVVQPSVQPAAGLKPGIPLACASLLVLGYVALAAIGIAIPKDVEPDQSEATVLDTGTGMRYANWKYGVEMRAPQGWKLQKGEEKEFARAEYLDGACSVILTRAVGLPLLSTRLLPEQLLKELQKQQPTFKLMGTKPSELGHKGSHDIVYSADVTGVVVTQTYTYVQDGFWVNLVIITEAEPLRAECDADIQSIRSQVVLPH